MKDIVSGPLDADKQDYLLRDSYFCGVKYGVYDLDRMVGTLCTHQDKQDRYLAITEDGINALEQFVLAKYYMTIQVYRHKIRSITDLMIERALRLGIQEDGIDWLKEVYTYDGSEQFLDTYKSWTDDRLINEVLSDNTRDGYLKLLFNQLVTRRLHKRIAKLRLVEFENPLVREALASLDSEQILALEKSIGAYLSIDPNLVMIGRLMFKSVREQSRNSESSILVTTATEPRSFEDLSTLFRSIDEAIREVVIEVYAPVTYPDEREKRRRQAEHQTKIHKILASIAPPPPEGGSEAMKPRDIVLVVLASYEGGIRGKTTLQKVCYFADVIADLQLGFKAHYYGPFSPMIEQAVAELKNLGFVEEEALGFGVYNQFVGEMRRYDYKLTADGMAVVQDLKRREPAAFQAISDIAKRIRNTGDPDYRELSIAAKTFFIARKKEGPITPMEIEQQAKALGWELSGESIGRAIDLLKKLDVVSVNS